MIDKTSIGRSVRSMEAQESVPYSRVVVYDSRGNTFESGDESGKTLYLENPFASQAIADRLAQNIVGFSYQPYSAKGAVIDPAAEIGDAISIHGLYSSIFQEDSSYGPQYAANIGAPGEEELTHEIPYISPSDRKIIRLNASVGRLGTAVRKTQGDIIQDRKNLIAALNQEDGAPKDLLAGFDSYVRWDLKNNVGFASSKLFAQIGETAKAQIGAYVVSVDGEEKSFVDILADQITLESAVEDAFVELQLKAESSTVEALDETVQTILSAQAELTTRVGNAETSLIQKVSVTEFDEALEAEQQAITELSSQVDGAEAKITLNAQNINGVASSVATIQADIVKLKGDTEILGDLSIDSGRLKVSKSIYTPNSVFANKFYSDSTTIVLGGTNNFDLSTNAAISATGITFGAKTYTPQSITSTTGTVLVLGGA